MRLTGPPTEAQIARVQLIWKRVSRLGLPLFVLASGSILFLWMALCYVGCMYVMHLQRLLHEPVFLASTVPCALLPSFLAPLAYYWAVRRMAQHYPPARTAI